MDGDESKSVPSTSKDEESLQQDPEPNSYSGSDQQDNSDDRAVCAICLGSLNTRTKLDPCGHCFCFPCVTEWLKHSAGGTCPMCKVIVKELEKETETAGIVEKIDAQALREKFKAEACVERGNAVQLNSEKEIIMARVRQLRSGIAKLDELERRAVPYRVERSYRSRGEMVQEATSLRSLADAIDSNGISRADLVSHPNFRRCIYTVPCERYSADDSNPLQRSFTPRVWNENPEAHGARLRPFILNELHHLTISSQTRRHQTRDSYYEECASVITDACGSHQIHSPTFLAILIGLGISRVSAEMFQHELFEYASSNLTTSQYCGISGYKKKPALAFHHRPRPTTNNFSVGGFRGRPLVRRGRAYPRHRGPTEVIDLSEDNEDVVLDDNEDVIVVDSDANRYPPSNQPSTSEPNQHESFYLRDDPDSGEDDHDDYNGLFSNPALLLNAIPERPQDPPSLLPHHFFPDFASFLNENYDDLMGMAPNMGFSRRRTGRSDPIDNTPIVIDEDNDVEHEIDNNSQEVENIETRRSGSSLAPEPGPGTSNQNFDQSWEPNPWDNRIRSQGRLEDRDYRTKSDRNYINPLNSRVQRLLRDLREEMEKMRGPALEKIRHWAKDTVTLCEQRERLEKHDHSKRRRGYDYESTGSRHHKHSRRDRNANGRFSSRSSRNERHDHQSDGDRHSRSSSRRRSSSSDGHWRKSSQENTQPGVEDMHSTHA